MISKFVFIVLMCLFWCDDEFSFFLSCWIQTILMILLWKSIINSLLHTFPWSNIMKLQKNNEMASDRAMISTIFVVKLIKKSLKWQEWNKKFISFCMSRERYSFQKVNSISDNNSLLLFHDASSLFDFFIYIFKFIVS